MTASIPPQTEPVTFSELVQSLRSFGEAIRNRRKMVVRVTSLAGFIGLFFAFGSGPEYTARTRVLPYRSAATAGGGLSSLAGLAGIRLPAGVADQTITADLYPEVAESQDFRIAVAETPLFFRALGRTASTVEYFRDLHERSVTELLAAYTINLPRAVLSAVQPTATASAVPPAVGAGRAPLNEYSRKYLKLVARLEDRLDVTIDKKTSVITITSRMPDPYAAADLVRVTSETLMQRIIAYESRKAEEQFRFISEQHRQAKARYEDAERAVAAFADGNRLIMSAMTQITRDRLQREFDLAFEVYQQFSRELEQARIKMNQDTPVFTVLEKVSVPPDRTSPKRTRIMIIALLAGVFISLTRVGLGLLVASRPAPTRSVAS